MFNHIESELKKQENLSQTENGAFGYKTTESALLDLNYSVSSLRNASEDEITTLFLKAYTENPEYALKWLFFARDIREGLGERRLFRVCYKELAYLDRPSFYGNLFEIPKYGRWDDLISLLGINDEIDENIATFIYGQICVDIDHMNEGKPISLLAKWMPSENASSFKTKNLAKHLRKLLKVSSKEYRVTLSTLRKYLDVVEVKMCDNKWEDIDYNKVPSLANLKYKEAFLRHDSDRREAYLESVKSGDSKMNMSVATPVDIISRYTRFMNFGWHREVNQYDTTLELAWDNLKNISIKDTLVVADGSGSMLDNVSKHTTALDVANALAIYSSEHNSGVYRNKYITFSSNPQFVDLTEADTLKGKLEIALNYCECSNTDIEKVFDLILEIAVRYNIPQDEMIKNVMIISDMEFDHAQRWGARTNILTKTLFEEIEDRYKDKGYHLPRLIFWNVNSRTGTIPVTTNELGVALVSGFSQNVLKMVMNNNYDPYQVLIETLDNKRYNRIKYYE